MLIFRNLCPNSFFKTSTQQTNRHPKDEHFVGEAANPKKTSPKIGPLKAPFIVSNSWPNFFCRQRINPQILRRIVLCNFFSTFLAGIARLHVFLWPFGKKAHHFFANITVKPPPQKDPLETPHVRRLFVVGVRHGAASCLQGQTCFVTKMALYFVLYLQTFG